MKKIKNMKETFKNCRKQYFIQKSYLEDQKGNEKKETIKEIKNVKRIKKEQAIIVNLIGKLKHIDQHLVDYMTKLLINVQEQNMIKSIYYKDQSNNQNVSEIQKITLIKCLDTNWINKFTKSKDDTQNNINSCKIMIELTQQKNLWFKIQIKLSKKKKNNNKKRLVINDREIQESKLPKQIKKNIGFQKKNRLQDYLGLKQQQYNNQNVKRLSNIQQENKERIDLIE